MKFAEKVYYCNIEDFWLSEQKAIDLGFGVENNMIYFPVGTHFKYISERGPSGWPVIEVNGEQMDFAGKEPIQIIL